MAKPQPNFFRRMMALRQKRIERRAGKALIHDEEAILDFVSANKVPTMIQHCVLKVSKKVGGDGKEKFISAFNICSACFSKHGYTRAGTMGMTGKGLKRNRLHQREKEASSKKAKYNGLVTQLWANSIKQLDKERASTKKPLSKPAPSNISKRRAARSKRK
jgi:hypothetical protein